MAVPCSTVPSPGAGCQKGPVVGSAGSPGPARHLGEGMHSWAAVSASSESPPRHYRCLGRPGGARLPASGMLNRTQGLLSAGPPSHGPRPGPQAACPLSAHPPTWQPGVRGSVDVGREVEASLTHRAGPAGAGGSSTQHVTSHVPGRLRGLKRETKLEPGQRGTPCQVCTPQYLHTLLGGGTMWQQCTS